MATWHSVRGLEDGENVAAATFNRPISELASRTDYLKNLIESITSNGNISNVEISVDLPETDAPSVGDIVCIDKDSKKYIKAIASMSLYDAYTASDRAFAVGVLTYKNKTYGIVVLYGKIDLSSIDMGNIVERGEIFQTGQYYLSSTDAGRITKYPKGPRVLVGFFVKNEQKNSIYSGDFAIINPQHMDIESHSHRTYKLLARPCGDAASTLDRCPGCDADNNDDVVVYGYPPDNEYVIDHYDHVRLSVGGCWTSSKDETYKIVISDGKGGPMPYDFPCYLTWSVVGSDKKTTVRLDMFGEDIPIGDNGLTVRFEAEPNRISNSGNDFSYVCGDEYPLENTTWTISNKNGRGWSNAGVNIIETLPSGHKIRIYGVADKPHTNIRFIIPRVISLLGIDDDKTLLTILPGDKLVIDNEEYTFTDDPDSDDIQILGSDSATFAQISKLSDKLFWNEDGEILIGSDNQAYYIKASSPNSHLTGECFSNVDDVRFALLVDDEGRLLSEKQEESQTGFSTHTVLLDLGFKFNMVNGLKYLIARQYSTDVSNKFNVGDSAEFDVNCVPGSKYRYNIEFDNDFNLHFPPVPAKSGSLMLNGIELDSYEHYGDNAVIEIGNDSIYWRDSTPGRQPWPISNMSQTTEVATEDEFRELFHFVSEFHSETGPVTSLRPAHGAPITIHRCGTNDDSTVGDLEIDVDLTVGMSDQNIEGYRVPKASRNGKLLLGPVVEKLIAGPGISFKQNANTPDGQGTVTISADGTVYQGDFETIALENAKVDSIGMFPYIRMLGWTPLSTSNIPTGFVAKFHVPATAINAVYRVKFYASVFGEESFEDAAQKVAGVAMDFNILPDYNSVSGGLVEDANLKTGLITNDKTFVLDIPFGVENEETGKYTYNAYDPLLIHNDSAIGTFYGKKIQVIDHSIPNPKDCTNYISEHKISGIFGVKPGYTVAVRFSRTDPSSGIPYTGDIGFLNLRWSIESVATVDSTTLAATEEIVSQTVMKLRKTASNVTTPDNGFEMVYVLEKLLNALR
jgi:hypothetical protein